MTRHPGSPKAIAWRNVIFLSALTLVLPSVAAAQSLLAPSSASPFGLGPTAADAASSDPEGALFLLIPVGARGVGMGRAMSALPGPEGAFWNPAGLAYEAGNGATLYRGDDLIAESTALSFIRGRSDLGTLALSYQLLDFGDQDQTGPGGEVLGRLSFRNHLGVLSGASMVSDAVAVGFNFKVIQLRETCRGQCSTGGVTATTWAFDLGFQGVPFDDRPLRLAAMVAHLGPRLQVVNAEQADPLPTRVRLSAAYEMLQLWAVDEALQLWTVLEVEDRWSSIGSEPSIYLGSEFTLGQEETVYARAGYVFGELNQNDGAAVGFGIRFQKFDLSLGKSLAASPVVGGSEPVHVSLGVRF